MSSKDDLFEPASDSFWEIDSYKRVVKRTEDGLHCCNELMKLIQERAEIEMKYATKLQNWAKRWNESIEKSTEYGTNKTTLLSSLDEAEAVANVHMEMKNNLLQLQEGVKKWRNEAYKKQMVGVCKEAKQFEEEFRKAQKPWAKHLGKFLKYKKEHQTACKNEKALETMIAAAGGSDEQEKKLTEKLEKAKKEAENYEDKLQSAFKELNSYRPIYVDDMTEVFQKTQDFEGKRLLYFKDSLVNIHRCLDISQNDQIPLIFIQWRRSLEMSDSQKDLKWWSEKYGADMNMKWPSLQENSEAETPQKIKSEPSPKPTRKAAETDLVSNSKSLRKFSYDTKLNPFGSDEELPSNNTISSHPDIVSSAINYDPDLNPFEDNPGDGGGVNDKRSSNHSSRNSTPVVALFDYNGQEDDELSFKKGDRFEKVKDKDEQGWCTGLKDGKIGLYPENFVKISN